MKADLNVFRPRTDVGFDYAEAAETDGFGTDVTTATEPRFPKSLYLVRPLFSAYDLNTVAPSAQESVPVPDGLDLNAWIVPPPQEEKPVPPQDEQPTEPKPKKSKKGKGKDTGAKVKGKKKKEPVVNEGDTLAAPPETEEERIERERVSRLGNRNSPMSLLTLPQRKAERQERLRDDPYYLMDDRSTAVKAPVDVEAIPVVRLDDLPPLPMTPGRATNFPVRST